MSEQDNQLQPLPENPTPQDFGFPEHPDSRQLQSWANQQEWLIAYAACGSVGQACAETGIPVVTAETWDYMDRYGFKKRKAHAGQMFLGKVEAELNRRVFEGYQKPIVYKGQLTKDQDGNVVTISVKEPTDLYFLAKKHDPAYKDNYQPQQSSTSINITQTVIEVHDYRRDGPELSVESQSWEITEDGKRVPLISSGQALSPAEGSEGSK
jgi:hypothetical protein